VGTSWSQGGPVERGFVNASTLLFSCPAGLEKDKNGLCFIQGKVPWGPQPLLLSRLRLTSRPYTQDPGQLPGESSGQRAGTFSSQWKRGKKVGGCGLVLLLPSRPTLLMSLPHTYSLEWAHMPWYISARTRYVGRMFSHPMAGNACCHTKCPGAVGWRYVDSSSLHPQRTGEKAAVKVVDRARLTETREVALKQEVALMKKLCVRPSGSAWLGDAFVPDMCPSVCVCDSIGTTRTW
jgi:hypothetical protein